MRLSLLQPEIQRGNIEHNRNVIQRLADQGRGELLVLPEYALTGSLTLDPGADIRNWARLSAQAEVDIRVPQGKYLLLNSLTEFDGELYNRCRLLPTQEVYYKLYPDQTELDAGIKPGAEQKVFELSGKRFKVLICYDLPHIDRIPTDNLDFLLFIYHFTESNFQRVLGEIRQISAERKLPVLASSLVSDMNCGLSSFINDQAAISLSDEEGILEIEVR